MPYPGIFRVDPPPPPRAPTAPIPKQGDQPPKGPTGALVNQYITRWAWEPPPPQPWQLPLTVAPLTLKYGATLPGRLPSSGGKTALWQVPYIWTTQPDPLPTIPQRLYDAPLTLAYGDQPPQVTGLRNLDLFFPVLVSWQPPDPLPQIPNRAYEAPLTLVYGDQPPPYSSIDILIAALSWQPPDPMPGQRPLTVAPLTLVYGSQPPQLTGLRDPDNFYSTVLPLWQQDPSPQQKLVGIAALQVVVVAAYVPPASSVNLLTTIRAWQSAAPQPQQNLGYDAPLTLVYGNQPPKYSIVGTELLVRSWAPPDPPPQRDRGYIVPLTLAYGDQPPRTSPAPLAALTQSWQPPWIPAQAAPSSAWNTIIVGFVPFAALQAHVVRSWQEPDPQSVQRVLVAPLTLPYGQQPPKGPTQLAVYGNVIVRSWEPPPPMPWQKPLTIAPVTLTYGQQPPRYSAAVTNEIIALWQPPWTPTQTAAPSAAWNVPVVVISAFVPFTPLQLHILRAWEPPWTPPQTSPPAAAWSVFVVAPTGPSFTVSLNLSANITRAMVFDVGVGRRLPLAAGVTRTLSFDVEAD